MKNLLKNLNIIRQEDLTIRLDVEKNVLFMKYESVIYSDVTPERPFPISHPEFIILKDAKGSDIGTIKDINKLNKESRESLEKLLDILYFIPRIVNIIRLEASGDKFEWETITDRGKRKFNTRGRSSITFVGNKIVISDTDDNLYQIENVEGLDEPSRNIIQSTF